MNVTAKKSIDERTEQEPQIRLLVEFCDAEALGVTSGPDGANLTDSLLFCLGLTSTVALRDDEVVLVITGDFVESVNARLPEGTPQDTYDRTRGAGTVGGKTMVVGNEVHVLLDAWTFYDADVIETRGGDAETVAALRDHAEQRGRLAQRTAAHEARHVAMEQAGEDEVDLDGLTWSQKNFVSAAHQLISEYRAELGVPLSLREDSEATLTPDSLATLRNDLRRIVAVEYQQHRVVSKLALDVMQQSLHLWKVLAYLAAARRVFGIPLGEPVLHHPADSEDWQLMVDAHWTDFERLLSDIPEGGVRVDMGELDKRTTALADLLPQWLRTFGFAWTTDQFIIESWHLVD